MRIQDLGRREQIMDVLVEPSARKILSSTMVAPKSVSEIADELGIPPRSAYRYAEELCELGLLATERSILIGTGGKYSIYRSLVKAVTLTYDGSADDFEVDLTPNDGILDKFLWFWTYMGGER